MRVTKYILFVGITRSLTVVHTLIVVVALAPRSDGVIGTFRYPSLAEDAGWNDWDTWQIRLRTVESLLPAQQAADLLERFYIFAEDTVSSYVGREMEDVADFLLRLGEVTLEVFCGDFICWGILGTFLREMGQRVLNGFVGMYEGHVVNVATGLSTWVKLSLRPPRPRLP